VVAAVTAKEVAPPAPAVPATPPPVAEPAALGTDVTTEYPAAVERDLLVFKRGKAHFVTKAEDPAVALNDEPLGTKKAVEGFIAALAQ
jgi:hypothetical protein